MDPKKMFLTHSGLGKLLGKLTEKIQKEKLDLEFVYGVPVNGLLVALHLSHFLNLKVLSELPTKYFFYTNEVIVVSGLINTGKTFEQIVPKDYRGIVKTATLFYKSYSSFKPDFYIEKTANYVIFPRVETQGGIYVL